MPVIQIGGGGDFLKNFGRPSFRLVGVGKKTKSKQKKKTFVRFGGVFCWHFSPPLFAFFFFRARRGGGN